MLTINCLVSDHEIAATDAVGIVDLTEFLVVTTNGMTFAALHTQNNGDMAVPSRLAAPHGALLNEKGRSCVTLFNIWQS